MNSEHAVRGLAIVAVALVATALLGMVAAMALGSPGATSDVGLTGGAAPGVQAPLPIVDVVLEEEAAQPPAPDGAVAVTGAPADAAATVTIVTTPVGGAGNGTQRSHTVAAGETLVAIGDRYGVSVAALVAANGITNPDIVKPGVDLVIPSGTVVVRTVTTRSYVVQTGDTLYSIATRFGTTPGTLGGMNGITDPTLIRVGVELQVPAQGAAGPAPAATARPAPTTTATAVRTATPLPAGSKYTVQPGDTLSSIAQRAGTTVAAIQAANALGSNVLIKPGDIITLPAGATIVAARPTAVPTPTATVRPAASATAAPTARPAATATPRPPVAASTAQASTNWQSYSVTYYCLGGHMGNGKPVQNGAIAADGIHPMGQQIEVEGVGIFTVMDRFAVDKRERRLDIWSADCGFAINWGIRSRNARIVG